MMADDASVAEQSLESEFASVKAASEVAAGIAPQVEAMSKQSTKPNPVVGAWRRTKSLVGLRKEVNQAAQELVGDECIIDEPEVCEEDTKNMARTIRKVLRVVSFGKATKEELAVAETAGDSMEEGWASRGKSSATKRTVEVWGFLLKCGLKVVKAGKTKGTDAEVSAAKTAAATVDGVTRCALAGITPTITPASATITTAAAGAGSVERDARCRLGRRPTRGQRFQATVPVRQE